MAEPTSLPSLPSGLPPAVSITIIVLTTVVSLGPTLLRTFSEFSGRSRVFKREKERLDLLKLRYEIEAFKRQKSLPDLTEPSLAFADSSAQTPPEATASPLTLSFLSRFVSGTMGAAIPFILIAIMAAFRRDYDTISNWGYLAASLIFSLIAGAVVTLIPRRQANRLICFLVGLSLTLVLQLVRQRALEQSPLEAWTVRGRIENDDGTAIPRVNLYALPQAQLYYPDGSFQMTILVRREQSGRKIFPALRVERDPPVPSSNAFRYLDPAEGQTYVDTRSRVILIRDPIKLKKVEEKPYSPTLAPFPTPIPATSP